MRRIAEGGQLHIAACGRPTTVRAALPRLCACLPHISHARRAAAAECLELVAGLGAALALPDVHGNTPLHHAAARGRCVDCY